MSGRERQVLVLGCNANQVPYIEAARALGFRVIGTDRNADAPGTALVDAFHPVAYDDVPGLLDAARKEALGPDDRVFTAAAHLAYEGAVEVARAAGIAFPSRDAIHTALDKTRFYPALERVGLRIPKTVRLRPEDEPELDAGRAYWLKSDYGKSPRYCWRVTEGRLPPRPEAFDAFYRAGFLLQEEIVGTHLRVNLWPGDLAVFERDGEEWHAREGLPQRVAAGLRAFVGSLGFGGWLTKFDLIEREGVHYVLDLGLDPPLRLRRACEARGKDFARAYTALYLCGDPAGLPCWEALRRGASVHVSTAAEVAGSRACG